MRFCKRQDCYYYSHAPEGGRKCYYIMDEGGNCWRGTLDLFIRLFKWTSFRAYHDHLSPRDVTEERQHGSVGESVRD